MWEGKCVNTETGWKFARSCLAFACKVMEFCSAVNTRSSTTVSFASLIWVTSSCVFEMDCDSMCNALVAFIFLKPNAAGWILIIQTTFLCCSFATRRAVSSWTHGSLVALLLPWTWQALDLVSIGMLSLLRTMNGWSNVVRRVVASRLASWRETQTNAKGNRSERWNRDS